MKRIFVAMQSGQSTSIVKATQEDIQLLKELGKISFIESHGSSGPMEDINSYVRLKYNDEALKTELSDFNNLYHIISNDKRPAGYSNILLNVPHANIQMQNVTKLDRLYILKEFYDLKLGLKLLNFNIELSTQNINSGMWLFVWKENQRAVNFYKKSGFEIIGSYDFNLTATHSNPNHQMFLKY